MGSALRVAALATAFALSGCASTNPKDPFESFNRAMFNFNDAVDQAAVKPAAEVYSTVLPTFVQTGVSNFFGNLGDVWTAVNNLLQGKLADGMSDVMRVAVNTTFGLGGLLDIGSEAGITKHSEDFGQTLGKWGVKSGPYVVLPILGPSTLRDTFAKPADFYGDLWSYYYPVHWRNTGSVIRAVDLRASVLDASTLLEEAALDRYQFVRDAYMQRRQSKVYDGDPPSSTYEDDVGPTLTAEDDAILKQKESSKDVRPAISGEPAANPIVKLEQNGSGATNAASATTGAKQ